MTKEQIQKIHKLYAIALIATTVIAGISLIVGCCMIYFPGAAAGIKPIYTRELVAQTFRWIAVPVYLCLIVVIAGFALHIVFPLEKKKVIPEKNESLILQRLADKTDLSRCEPELQRQILGQRQQRHILLLISGILLGIGSALFLFYACDPHNWAQAHLITHSMVAAMMLLIPCMGIPAGFGIFAAYAFRRSLRREIELMRQANRQAPCQASAVKAAPSRIPIHVIRCCILAIAVALILYGYYTEGFRDVINKAAAICTECIGLG